MDARIWIFPTVEGTGKDDIGEFRWISNQRKSLRESIRFTKVYRTHEVAYHGKIRGGLITGRVGKNTSVYKTQFCFLLDRIPRTVFSV